MKYFKSGNLLGLWFVIMLLYFSCGIDSNKKNNGFLIEKNRDNYSIKVLARKNSLKGPKSFKKLLVQNADSIISSYKYGTMIYGTNPENSKEGWFYIDASSPANFSGEYSDEVFRKEEIITIGKSYLDSVKTIEQYLSKN